MPKASAAGPRPDPPPGPAPDRTLHGPPTGPPAGAAPAGPAPAAPPAAGRLRPQPHAGAREARAVANLVLLLLVALVIGFLVSSVQRRRRTLVGKRGTSIGADLGALSDQPTVRVREVTQVGPDAVRLVLTPEAPASGGTTSADQVFIVALPQWDAGYELLQEWQRSGKLVAVVLPPGSRLVRLRSIDDLQPLTLRRLDEG